MGFFSTTAETTELHSNANLRSHYYKANYKKIKTAINEYVNQTKATIKNINDEHKELFIEFKRYHIIVSVIQVTPIESSVDFKVEHYGLVGMNRPAKAIVKFYEHLDKALPFKGVGLHP